MSCCQPKNWCRMYDHEIDFNLIKKICKTIRPRGCFNCSQSYYKKIESEKK